MWSEIVDLRIRPVSDQKIGLGLGLACGLSFDHAGLMSYCETRSCYARRHNDLEGHSNFSSTVYSFSFLCLEHHYCMWRSTVAFTYLKVKSAKSCKGNTVLLQVHSKYNVIRNLQSWCWSQSWSKEFGLVYIAGHDLMFLKAGV